MPTSIPRSWYKYSLPKSTNTDKKIGRRLDVLCGTWPVAATAAVGVFCAPVATWRYFFPGGGGTRSNEHDYLQRRQIGRLLDKHTRGQRRPFVFYTTPRVHRNRYIYIDRILGHPFTRKRNVIRASFMILRLRRGKTSPTSYGGCICVILALTVNFYCYWVRRENVKHLLNRRQWIVWSAHRKPCKYLSCRGNYCSFI